jgi:hypothetical protein
MSKINGTNVLLYADGVLIACERSATLNIEQDLPDASCKDDGGWASHIKGTRSGSIEFEALYSTTGLSAAGLIGFITGRTDIVAVCNGIGIPFVFEGNVQSVNLVADMESPVAVSGSIKANGAIYFLTGGLVTSWTNGDYDTFTSVTTSAITAAVNAAGSAYANSNTFAIATGEVFKVIVVLALASGQVPAIVLDDTGDISNQVNLANGVNVITLTATDDAATGTLRIENSGASNYSTSNVYVFKT